MVTSEKRRTQNKKSCAAYRAKNPMRGRERVAKWRAENPEKLKELIAKNYGVKRAHKLIAAAKSQASKKNSLPFNLQEHKDYYQKIIDEGYCQLTGLKFSMDAKSPFAPSLDRIIPNLGYVHGNVRVIVFALNMGLGAWGEDAYLKVAEAYVSARSGRRFPWQ